ncbi:MAG: molybdate ABC transporter substrate-binding protein [Tepidisphaeraceae bacterium]
MPPTRIPARLEFRRRCIRTILLINLLLLVRPVLAESINVAGAVSLKESLTEIAREYETRTHEHIDLVFGSSGHLMTQIANGAPVDLFISAANEQVDSLIRDGVADATTRRVIAMNRLVLIVPGTSGLGIRGFDDLKRADVARVAVGEPRTVPAGAYAMQVLKSLQLDESTRGRIVYGANVRQVLEYVQRGEVSAGIVYQSDGQSAGDKVRVIATAPPDSHEPIEYPVVLIKSSPRKDAAMRFVEFLRSETARREFQRHGLIVDAAPVPGTMPTR